METTYKQRLVKFIEYKNLNPRSFEIAIGGANAYVGKLKDSSELSPKYKKRIKAAFPDLNLDWLELGIGDMLNKTESSIACSSNNIQNSSTGDVVQITNAPASGNERIKTYEQEIVELKDKVAKLKDLLYGNLHKVMKARLCPSQDECNAKLDEIINDQEIENLTK